jgi:hypothetical protein
MNQSASTSSGSSFTEPLGCDEYEEIHLAFENIKQKYRDVLGEKDICYIKKIHRNSRIFEVIGRSLIHILPGPFALIGVPFLFLIGI